MLTDEQRRHLLELARRSVAARVAGRPLPAVHALELPRAFGVFVTLKLAGQLRGCLGTLESASDLASDVARCAADAASEDPRFPAVTASELAGVALEISVLGPLERLDGGALDALGGLGDRSGSRLEMALTMGVHGLVVEHGPRRGLLLPQVAIEWGWSPEQFLRQTCVKAGLAPEAWAHGAIVYRFRAEVFGEA